MFSKDKAHVKNRVMEINVISKNTSIVGDIKSEGDFRIDGTLEGKLITNGKVIIGEHGSIKGTVESTNADIEGAFNGKLLVSQTLTIKSKATITGDVVIGKLSVEPGATFNATCSMKGAVKELKNNGKKLQEQTA